MPAVNTCESQITIPISAVNTGCISGLRGFVVSYNSITHTGTYFDQSTGTILSFTNTLLFPLAVSQTVCIDSGNVVGTQPLILGSNLFNVQILKDNIPVTSTFPLNIEFTAPALQYFINQATLAGNTVIVNSFTGGFSGSLVLTTIIQTSIGMNQLQVTVTGLPTITYTSSFTCNLKSSKRKNGFGGFAVLPENICLNPQTYTGNRPNITSYFGKNYVYTHTDTRGFWCYTRKPNNNTSG